MQVHSRLYYGFSALWVGCLATLMQVILFRELMVLLEGNELVLSLMLVWWLLGISLGALLPSWYDIKSRLSFWFPFTLLCLPLIQILSTVAIRLSPWILSMAPQENPSPGQIVWITSISVIPAAFFIGLTFPILSLSMKNSSSHDSDAYTVGTIFTYESLGSVLGGILLLFQVVPRWNSFQIAFLAWIGVFILFVLPASSKRRISIGFMIAILCVAYQWDLPQAMNMWSAQMRWNARHTGYRFLRALETPYQRLELGERDEQYTVFGNGNALFSFPDEYTYSQWAFMSMSQFPNPSSILLIGNAGNELAPYYVQHRHRNLSIIESDIGIREIGSDRFRSRSEKRNETTLPTWIYSDAIHYISRRPWQESFDLIVVNQPNPGNAVINRFYTREFFQSLRNVVSEEGVVVITATGTPNNEQGDVGYFCSTLYWTLRDVFPHVLVIPGTEWWFFASPQRDLLDDPQTVIEQFQRLHPETQGFSPEIFSMYYEKYRIQQVRDAFQENRNLPRNSDFQPLCYLHHLFLWSKQYGYWKGFSTQWVTDSLWRWIGIGMGIGLLLILIISIPVRGRFPNKVKSKAIPLVSLFIAGFSSMAAELVILLLFQSRVGYLYQHIGLFFGIFMLGLAWGTSVCNRCFLSRPVSAFPWLNRLILIFSLLFLISPWILSQIWIFGLTSIGVEILLLSWLMILSFQMGMILPMVARVLEERGIDLATLAGWIDACDCAGGAWGALLTGLFLIPIMGLLPLFYGLSAFNGLSALMLYIYFKNRVSVHP